MKLRLIGLGLLAALLLPAQETLDSITIHLARSPQQVRELEDFVESLHLPGHSNYQRWLTPEQFAERFGPSRETVARVRQWASSNGLKVDYEAPSRSYLVVSGEMATAARAFGIGLRKAATTSRRRLERTGELKLPPDVAHVSGLDDLRARPQSVLVAASAANGTGNNHFLAPDDFATIYNVNPALGRGTDGTGQRIAVVGQSAVDIEDTRAFRRRYNLPVNDPEMILYPGSADPGRTNDGDEIEGNLDIQWVGAIARRARVTYVYGTSAVLAISYAVERNVAPVLSVSFTVGCEAMISQGTMHVLQQLAQQAAAQGITWINASGDAGPAGCDGNRAVVAQNGFGAEVPNTVPEITSIGGTELNDRGGNYWRASNDANGASALGYIPETTWNQSERGYTLASGGGGISTFFARPPWQNGAGIGNQNFRMVPDLSLAGSTYNGYSVIHRGQPTIVGGTSAGTPAFAGMLALILQATNKPGGYGNINRILYPIAEAQPDVFHDITEGHTRVPCIDGTKDCSNGSFGFQAGPRYDLATGLGSVDFERLLNAWPRTNATQSLMTFTAGRNPVYATASSTGASWLVTFNIREHAGVGTTMTSFKTDGQEQIAALSAALGSAEIAPFGGTTFTLTSRNVTTPYTGTFEMAGRDASGQTWTRTLYIDYAGSASTPRISGIANGASFAQSFAPGSVLSVFGSNLANGTQVAGAVPLTRFSQGLTATVNGELARFYYVSPTQVNLQVPTTLFAGPATLTLTFPSQGSASVNFTLNDAAPGIFTSGDLYTVPQRRCARGETCILFITGQGAINPTLRTGDAPAASTIAGLPKPVAPVSMTIGGAPAEIVFAGIPNGLVGVTQINFTVAANTPVGAQRVVVKVGASESAGATIEVF